MKCEHKFEDKEFKFQDGRKMLVPMCVKCGIDKDVFWCNCKNLPCECQNDFERLFPLNPLEEAKAEGR